MLCGVYRTFSHGCGHLFIVNKCRNHERLGPDPSEDLICSGCDPTTCLIFQEEMYIIRETVDEDAECPSCVAEFTEPHLGLDLFHAQDLNGHFDEPDLKEMFEITVFVISQDGDLIFETPVRNPVQPIERVFRIDWSEIGREAWENYVITTAIRERARRIPRRNREYWVGINDDGALLRRFNTKEKRGQCQ